MTRRGCVATILAGLALPGRMVAALSGHPDPLAGQGRRVVRHGWILRPDDLRCVRETGDVLSVREAGDA